MDIVLGSGRSRKVVTFSSGAIMRRFEKEEPIEYVKTLGNLVTLVREQKKG